MSAGATCGGLREQILSAAGECFRNRGFKATTMHEIAKRAGMSVGNLYNYFDGKDAIVDELAKREIGRLASEVDAVVNGRMSVEEQRDQFFEMLLRQLTIERARVNVELYEEATRSDRLGQILRSSDKQVRALIKKMYRSRAGAGLSEEALEEKVEMAIALCDGLTFRLIANPTMDRERVARAVADVIVR